ncbi:MAG: heat-inducible transcription repressor HrcA [Bryobacterales bacterium]|nr:heat-inducible transcription repressor HrcA [Bryobacterales bacterium]
MRREHPLTARTEQILCSIVRNYIETGEPVASLDISRLRRFQLSPASIRNVMAELAAEGYLHQPHASAGRVPTGKAFEVFVETLPGRRLQADELARIRERLSGADSLEQQVGQCSQMLTEMTQGVALSAAIPTMAQRLDQVELVSLGGPRVLMVVVTGDKLVRDVVVTLDQPVTAADLTPIRNYLNMEFNGWLMHDIQPELERRLAQASAQYGAILQRLVLLYERSRLSQGLAADVAMDGASNLVLFELQLTRDKLKELFRTLEEKKRILHLLERFLAQPAGEVDVRIGLEAEHPAMGELSLIGVRVELPGGVDAKIAVLGPHRMDYQRAMSAVMHVGRALGTLPS